MTLTLAAVVALAQQCAPGIATEALVPQLRVESQFNELAIGINHGPTVKAASVDDAVSIATRYIRAGYSVDLGLAQINSHNLARLNMTVAQAFDACTSLRAAETVLTENYALASQSVSGLDAISRTWSYYNSGSPTRGYANGYVGKVWAAANELLPQLRGARCPGRRGSKAHHESSSARGMHRPRAHPCHQSKDPALSLARPTPVSSSSSDPSSSRRKQAYEYSPRQAVQHNGPMGVHGVHGRGGHNPKRGDG